MDVNQRIVELLEKFELYYRIKEEPYRAQSFQRAALAISRLRKPIIIGDSTRRELLRIPGIGKGIAERIMLFLNNELESNLPDDFNEIINTYTALLRIRGVGPSKARIFVAKGVKSVADLRKLVRNGKIKLNKLQLLGLKYYNDLIRPIPHAEVKKIEKLLQSVGKKVNAKLQVSVVGSYRRRKPVSRDLDVLVFHPNIKTPSDFITKPNYLQQFVDALSADKRIKLVPVKTQSLHFKRVPRVISAEYFIHTPYSKWYRKIDLKFYPMIFKPTALLYFTGNRDLNRQMRERAQRKGLKLNEYCLCQLLSDGGEKALHIHSEADVFKKLGMKYLPPYKRNV